jgi:CBS domain containing-hemolysin-like protein
MRILPLSFLTDMAYLPWLAAMGMLVVASAFFSCSEAALFYLNRQDRRAFAKGTRAQRVTARLLDDPDKLLTSVLFWNLMVNVAYFTIASILGLKTEDNVGGTEAATFAVSALLVMIFFSEMIPKSLGVLHASRLAMLLGPPLSVAVQASNRLMPVFQVANRLSRRVLWPGFQGEPYLEVADLERAVHMSSSNAALVEHERAVLQNVLQLSNLRAEEVMRPRTRFLAFRPPLSMEHLQGQVPPSGYVMVTEPDSDEVAGAIPICQMSHLPEHHLERYAEEVIYVPWSTNVAHVLETMRQRDLRVAAVINEFGETIGILTSEDILGSIFSDGFSRVDRWLERKPIVELRPGVWRVTGSTNLRRLSRYFQTPLPETHRVTVAGMVQEVLERLPESGDQGDWGEFHFEVVEATQNGRLIVELTRLSAAEERS